MRSWLALLTPSNSPEDSTPRIHRSGCVKNAVSKHFGGEFMKSSAFWVWRKCCRLPLENADRPLLKFAELGYDVGIELAKAVQVGGIDTFR